MRWSLIRRTCIATAHYRDRYASPLWGAVCCCHCRNIAYNTKIRHNIIFADCSGGWVESGLLSWNPDRGGCSSIPLKQGIVCGLTLMRNYHGACHWCNRVVSNMSVHFHSMQLNTLSLVFAGQPTTSAWRSLMTKISLKSQMIVGLDSTTTLIHMRRWGRHHVSFIWSLKMHRRGFVTPKCALFKFAKFWEFL